MSRRIVILGGALVVAIGARPNRSPFVDDAVDALLGRPPSVRPARAGYFWSDQFKRRLQFAGRTSPGEFALTSRTLRRGAA